jgi:hypothetical protein
MRNYFNYIIIFLISFIIFNGCKKDIGYPESKTNSQNSSACDSSSVTYTNFVANVMSSNCTFSGCHNSGSSVDLTTYASLKLKIDDGTFNNRVLVQKDMPPSYSSGPVSLDACALGKLKKWINNGAPQ